MKGGIKRSFQQSIDTLGGPAALHKRSESVTFPKKMRNKILHETVIKRKPGLKKSQEEDFDEAKMSDLTLCFFR